MALSKMVDKQVKMNRKPLGLKLFDIEDIIENNLNFYSQDGIEELAENIKTYGLMKPLEVYQKDDKYILIGGHRRLKALQYLFNLGDTSPEKKVSVSTPHENIKKLNKMIKKYNKDINDIFWEFSSEERNLVIGTTESGDDITIDMIINKLAGITILITESFDKLK